MMPPQTCAILILNWNGITHLEALLPSLRAAVSRSPSDVDCRGGQPEYGARRGVGIGASFPKSRWSLRRAMTTCSLSMTWWPSALRRSS